METGRGCAERRRGEAGVGAAQNGEEARDKVGVERAELVQDGHGLRHNSHAQ